MSGYIIRPVSGRDHDPITALWGHCFGDDEALIRGFLTMLPELGAGAAAELDGETVGMAFAICGLELSGSGRRVGYIYAVAVDERCRGLGIGAALTRAAADYARALGAEIICTLPAEDSLYPWYEKLIGTHCILHRSRRIVPPLPGAAARDIGAEEYNAIREKLLAGTPHLRAETPCIAFQELLCRTYGGGLYAFPGGIAAAYLEGNACVIRELICAEPLRAAYAASLAAKLGADTAVLCTSEPNGEKYVAIDTAVPTDTVWNIAFD